MNLPKDVTKMVTDFATDPVINAVLYQLHDNHMALLTAHVYRVNGVIEAKVSSSTKEGHVMGQPLRVPTATSLKAFVLGCAPWEMATFPYLVIVYRGIASPPEEFTTVPDGTNGSYVWWAVRKHFEPTVHSDTMIGEALLDGRDPIEVFSAYAWNLLNEKDR